MYPTILVPLDGSELSAAVLPTACELARHGPGSLTLLRVASRGAQAEARAYLQAQAATLQKNGCAVAVEVRSGPVADTILGFSEASAADLIAMSTHGRGGLSRALMGSVADRVVRSGRLPVLVRRATESAARGFNLRRLLVPVDSTPLAEEALVHAQRLAAACDGEVLLLYVWDSMGYQLGSFPENELDAKKQEEHAAAKFYIIETTHRLQHQGVRARWKLLSGPISQCIVQTAKSSGADLVVMATHGLTGISRMVEGSIADEVLHATQVPLLLVRGAEP